MSSSNIRFGLRVIIGGLLAVVLLVIVVSTRNALADTGIHRSLIGIGRVTVPESGAIQAAQIYAHAAYQTLIAIGAAVAAYILTRIRD